MNNVTKMIPIVFSTAIRAVAYNESGRALTIMFTSGGTYQFSGVNPRLAMGFTFAESPGTYYNEKIRDQGFSSQKLVDGLFGQPEKATVTARRPNLPNLVHADMAPSHARVLNVFLNKGAMTAGEMKQFSGNDNDEKRLAELQRLGALMVTGQTVCSVTGRKAQVWAPNPEFMNF